MRRFCFERRHKWIVLSRRLGILFEWKPASCWTWRLSWTSKKYQQLNLSQWTWSSIHLHNNWGGQLRPYFHVSLNWVRLFCLEKFWVWHIDSKEWEDLDREQPI